jgi:hypothetical protein
VRRHGSAAVPEAGVGGFAGYANASGTTVCVGLPAELRDGLAPLLDGLGIAGACDEVGTNGIRIDLAQTQADLRAPRSTTTWTPKPAR